MRHILTLFTVLASAQLTLAHASHKMHEADIFAVFNGYDELGFKRIAKRISSDMDNELPRRFRVEIGSVPGNHRLLGHCWTFGDAIPQRVLDAVEERHPGRKTDFIRLWQTFANEIIADVAQTTGLPRKQAGALAALIHDVHLLGDRTPDNMLVDHVLTTQEIRRNVVKSAGVIWGRRGEVTMLLKTGLANATAGCTCEPAKAQAMLETMKASRLGASLSSIIAEWQLRKTSNICKENELEATGESRLGCCKKQPHHQNLLQQLISPLYCEDGIWYNSLSLKEEVWNGISIPKANKDSSWCFN